MKKDQLLFDKFTKNAKQEDISRIEENLPGMNRGPIKKIWDQVKALWNLLQDPNTPWGKKAIIIGALVYLISPIDAVPDPIPFFGLLDDVAVIGLAIKSLKDLIEGAKQAAIETTRKTEEVKTRAHLRRMRISLVVSITVAVLAIAIIIIRNRIIT